MSTYIQFRKTVKTSSNGERREYYGRVWLPAWFFAHLHTCPSWTWLSKCRPKTNICMLFGCLHVLSLHRNDASTHRVWLLALYVVRWVHVVWLHTSIELCSPCTLLGELTQYYYTLHTITPSTPMPQHCNGDELDEDDEFLQPNWRYTLPTSTLLHVCIRTNLE